MHSTISFLLKIQAIILYLTITVSTESSTTVYPSLLTRKDTMYLPWGTVWFQGN